MNLTYQGAKLNYINNNAIQNVMASRPNNSLCLNNTFEGDIFCKTSVVPSKTTSFSELFNNNLSFLAKKVKQPKSSMASQKEYYQYHNIFKKRLKSTPKPNFEDLIAVLNLHDAAKAATRISSFSKYLKEQMVGFITPEGEHWFNGACKYLILATAGVPIRESDYEKYAKEFWGLMAHADHYWTSHEFISYLGSMDKEDAGVKATLSTIKNLNMKEQTNSSEVSFKGNYETTLTDIKELLDNGCAYSGKQFSVNEGDGYPTIEHLFPHSAGGDNVNVDSNYVLVKGLTNNLRGNIPLTEFLKGWDGLEFEKQNPDWKNARNPYVEYRNRLSSEERTEAKQTLINTNIDSDYIRKRLLKDKNYQVHNMNRATKRIQNLSRYLKEEMVGFITPSGKDWFEDGCKYLIKGTAGLNITEPLYEKHAKLFWGLMAKADPYWESLNFINYLNTLEKNPGVEATIKVIQDLNQKKKAPNAQVSFGYSSQLKFIPELVKSCAFSNTQLNHTIGDPQSVSVDHIFPNSIGGDEGNEDSNYLVVSLEENGNRGNLSILEFLMGWNANEFEQIHPGWLRKRVINAKKHIERA